MTSQFESGDGGKISSKSSLKYIQKKIGQSCLGFRHSIFGGSARLPMLAGLPSSGLNDSFRKGMRKSGWGFRTRSGVAAFTLVDAMMSTGIMVLFTAACLSSVVVNQVSVRKSKEEAIAMDFLTKYTENIKALPFTSVVAGLPINNLYNGVAPNPLITIPPNGTWVPLNTTLYEKWFYSDLLWLNNRQSTNAGDHDAEHCRRHRPRYSNKHQGGLESSAFEGWHTGS